MKSITIKASDGWRGRHQASYPDGKYDRQHILLGKDGEHIFGLTFIGVNNFRLGNIKIIQAVSFSNQCVVEVETISTRQISICLWRVYLLHF